MRDLELHAVEGGGAPAGVRVGVHRDDGGTKARGLHRGGPAARTDVPDQVAHLRPETGELCGAQLDGLALAQGAAVSTVRKSPAARARRVAHLAAGDPAGPLGRGTGG